MSSVAVATGGDVRATLIPGGENDRRNALAAGVVLEETNAQAGKVAKASRAGSADWALSSEVQTQEADTTALSAPTASYYGELGQLTDSDRIREGNALLSEWRGDVEH